MLPTLEVEAILGRHQAVKDVVVVGYQDPAVAGADLACAFVVPVAEPPTLAELREFLDEQQVSVRDWPDRLEIVAELPRNAQGKVLRSALRQQLD